MMLNLIIGSTLLCQGGDLSYAPHEEPPIAYFDVVPQQDVAGVFDMGVIAYHLEGVDRVEYTIHREGFQGDYNWDGTVDAEDLTVLFANWNSGVSGKALTRLLACWGTATPFQDEVVVVREQTMNDRTGQEEYWFGLDTRLDPDTKIRVTAEVFPVDGPSLVLNKSHELNVDGDARPFHNGVNLFSNNYGQWKIMERYVSPNGSDETGDGTIQNPYRGMHRAIRHNLTQPYAEVGGTIVYLMEGDHIFDSPGPWPLGAFRQSEGRFVTVTPAPGVDPEACKIVGSNGSLMYTGKVHFKNIVVESEQEHILSQASQAVRWYDNCSLRGDETKWWNGEYYKLSQTHGLQYYTDCYQAYQAEASNGPIMRNVHYDYIQCDAIEAHYIQLGLDLLITHHNENYENFPTGCHSDYMQYNPVPYTFKNVIFRDIFANHSCQQQGCHMEPGGMGSGGAVHDVAWINVEISNTGGLNLPDCHIDALIWRWGGPTRNMLMKNCILKDKPNGTSHSMWGYSRFNDDGSQNIEGPWCVGHDGVSPRFINIKVEDCWQNWEKTEPLFPAPDGSDSWGFYGPEEMQWDSSRSDGVQENPFGPDDPWFSQITGIYYTQTE